MRDNGTQISSQSFKEFAWTYGFEHITLSPLYPQSNGKAEKGVQIVEGYSVEDPYQAIFNYRASPLANGLSPAEMLMKRKLRTRFPLAKRRKEHSATNNPKECQINAYNRTAVPLKPLAQEEIVWVRCDGQWWPLAKVIEVTGPRSNEVIAEHGQTLRRNRSSRCLRTT